MEKITITFKELRKIVPKRRSGVIRMSDVKTFNNCKRMGYNACRFDVMLNILELFKEDE